MIACAVVQMQQSAFAGQKLTGNLEISVTRLANPFKNVRIKQFQDDAAIEKSILASACILPPPVYVGGYGLCMDGCYSDFQILQV